jgi:hypothetical protein
MPTVYPIPQFRDCNEPISIRLIYTSNSFIRIRFLLNFCKILKSLLMKENLSRYTSLASAIDTLTRNQITLLDPAGWEDRTDSITMLEYKRKGEFKSVLAACFTSSNDTFHHWSVFAKPGGVCIRFHKAHLCERISLLSDGTDDNNFISIHPIQYHNADDPRINKYIRYDDLPFIKQDAYAAECEWRVLFRSQTEDVRQIPVPIEPFMVSEIILDPWLPDALVDPLRDLLRKIDGYSGLNIRKSIIVKNDAFINRAKGAASKKDITRNI